MKSVNRHQQEREKRLQEMKLPSLTALALLVAVTRPGLVHGAEPIADFILKTDKVETSVFLDAKIKANPSLAANCLAEGKKWAETQHAENLEARPTDDPNLIEWRYRRDYRFLSIVADRYVSLMRMDSWNTGNGYDF